VKSREVGAKEKEARFCGMIKANHDIGELSGGGRGGCKKVAEKGHDRVGRLCA